MERGEREAPELETLTETHQRLVFVGDPGGGKTTFLRRLAYRHSGRGGTQFPVLIRIFELEDYIYKGVRSSRPDTPTADSVDWIPRFLEFKSGHEGWGLNAEFWRMKLRQPATALLLDGLDEIPEAGRRQAMARLFENATRAFREARFIVTTRPAAYEGKATLDGFEKLQIDRLETEAVEAFLEQWAAFLWAGNREKARKHTQELMEARKASRDIRKMTENPLMLTALAVIHWNQKKIPKQRAQLYESILTWLSEAREAKERRRGRECLAIFGALALGMQTWPGGRVRKIEKSLAARTIAGRFRNVPEAEREAEARAFLENELIDSGIVVSRGDSLEFWHLTFQEYLAARSCVDLNAVDVLTAGDRWQKQEWREVLLLLAGILIGFGQTRVDEIFETLLEQAEAGALPLKARTAGLLGALLGDLEPSGYRPDSEARYTALMTEILSIFDEKVAATLDVRLRRDAAEALGQAGDPRLKQLNSIWFLPGTFRMGEGAEAREVTIERPFAMGRYAVTVEEFRAFVEDEDTGYSQSLLWTAGGYQKGQTAPDEWEEQDRHPNRPVVNVTWFAAMAYCAWLSLHTGMTVRLPSEEEWEFAARGTSSRTYPWGETKPGPNHANFNEAGLGEVAPVGLFPAGNTPEGLGDMAGNVWEWTGSGDAGTKILRGAAFRLSGSWLRAAYRDWGQPDGRLSYLGFRWVRE
jgi:formylglycine-generating enzyme required for sulfatase activity